MLTTCWNCRKECEEDNMGIDPVSGNPHSRVCEKCWEFLVIPEKPIVRARVVVEGRPDPSEVERTYETQLRTY